MDPDEFRKHGHELVDWLTGYMETVEELPVHPDLEPGDIKARLPAQAPVGGEPMEAILADFKELILPGMTHWQHPSWFAYFPANNSPPSVLAELLTAGLGAQCMIWQSSPAAEELEERTLEWLRDMLGLPKQMTGVIQDTASTATLVALLTAREKATWFRFNQKGIASSTGSEARLIVYCSEEAHSSVIKGAKIAGYGRENLRLIAADEKFAMLPEELELAIESDLEAGHIPACVCATLGTTSSCGFDPLDRIGPLCRKHGIWLHVDAAYAGTAAILPEKRWMLNGMEFADSFVFNPHKWMLVNFDCSAYFVRDPELLRRTFAIHPEYLRTGVDAQVNNYRDWGIQLGRRFRALKLWFVLRYYGVEGLQSMVRRHIEMARTFAGYVEAEKDFQLMAPVELSLVCFRYAPPGGLSGLPGGRTEEELDGLNEQLLDCINRTGKTLLTQTRLKGRYVIRVSIGQRTTEHRHVEALWALVRETAAELS